MPIDLDNVLADARAKAPIRERLELLLRFFNNVTGKDPDEAIISEYLAKDKEEVQHVFKSVFYILGSNLFESKNFTQRLTLDCLPLSSFNYWEFDAQDFDDAANPLESSQVTLSLSSGLQNAVIHATGANCSRLRRIFVERMRDHIGGTFMREIA